MAFTMDTCFGTVIYPRDVAHAFARLSRNEGIGEFAGHIEQIERSTEHYQKVVDDFDAQLLKDERIYLDTGATDHLRKYFDWIELPEWFKEGEDV